MEPKRKVDQFTKLLKDAVERNDVLTVTLLTELRPSITNTLSPDKFDKIIFEKIEELANNATSLLKKKKKTLAEKEIYCLSLLSHCFFSGQVQVSIEDKKVIINDKRV